MGRQDIYSLWVPGIQLTQIQLTRHPLKSNLFSFSAVVDLNGRFFGGREVRASFYDVFKFQNLNLTE